MICVVKVDDTILAGPNAKSIKEEIKGIEIRQDEQRHSFELRDEGEVGYFLGISIERQKDLKHDQSTQLKLSHLGLKNAVRKESHLSDFNPRKKQVKQ